MKPFTIQYAPKSLDKLYGRQDLAKQLQDFITNYAKQKKKAILLFGPSGVGKTSLVTALSHILDCELFEMNASDQRNKAHIEETLKPVTQTRSFFSANKIILLDEVDGLSGHQDRGGATSIANIIKESKFPIILTANDGYAQKLKPIRKVANAIEVPPLQVKDVVAIMNDICIDQATHAPDDVLASIARKNMCDVRGSLADLEVLSTGKNALTQDDLDLLGDRAKVQSMQHALAKIYKSFDAKGAFDEVTENPDDWLMWLEYNTAKEYTHPLDRAKAYAMIAKADVIKGRIRRRQHWRLLVYMIDLLTSGVSWSKKEPYKSPPNYKESSRALSMWMLNNKVAKKKSIAAKIAEKTHSSTKQVMNNFAHYHQLCKQPNVQHYFELDEGEVEWLAKV